MLAHHVVDVDVDPDARALLQLADSVGSARAVDDAQLALGDQHGTVADLRISRDAALESRHAATLRISPISSRRAMLRGSAASDAFPS